ncbi:hypothetical protein [Natronorubrum aibiense]|uniref:CARDB domain-containing protein n=1 Tax=Natronorubrum aibiense TaxID=348826 RepID=A0A5P9PAB4_9EURY|nr:hypothetical protein [Natronorubrum aibiense]QFU84947.1 hypothetical protein GCU68_20715 [Natronorubrum aibiense]
MMGKHGVAFLVGIAILGLLVTAVTFTPTIALFSDASTFEDNSVSAAEEWDRVSVTADAPANVTRNETATLEVTVENDGHGPIWTEYEVVVDNETVETESGVLEGGETWTTSHEFDTTTADDIDWEVTANGDSENGTLSVLEDSAGTAGVTTASTDETSDSSSEDETDDGGGNETNDGNEDETSDSDGEDGTDDGSENETSDSSSEDGTDDEADETNDTGTDDESSDTSSDADEIDADSE